MDMTDQAVELRYGVERRDVREMLRWRAVTAPGGRKELLLYLLLLPLAGFAFIVIREDRPMGPPELALAGAVSVPAGAGVLLFGGWRLARRMYRSAAVHPEYRCVIDERGFRTHRSDGTVEDSAWEDHRGWAETRNLFVFVCADGALAAVPKRAALVPEDLDRLRELSARKLPRV
ncbi:YcxB family protein [Streptomyces sp. NPDC127110]|uniref:YcxB family protein n=1 Tax=Streptomyces sp. NPDC127110 TaxID=3345362 RepID=UPI00363D57D8